MRIQEIEKTQPLEKTHYEKIYQSAKGSFDLANLFFELAVNVSSKTANNAYIFPHKFLNADSGAAFRDYLTHGKYIDKLAHFGANMVFDSADTYTCIALFSQQQNAGFNFQRFPFKSDFTELLLDESKFQFLSYQSIQNASALYGANNWLLFESQYNGCYCLHRGCHYMNLQNNRSHYIKPSNGAGQIWGDKVRN